MSILGKYIKCLITTTSGTPMYIQTADLIKVGPLVRRGQGTEKRTILSILGKYIKCLITTTYGTPMYIQTADLIKVGPLVRRCLSKVKNIGTTLSIYNTV